MTVLGLLGLFNTFVGVGLPQMAETFRMAWLGDPDIPDYSLRIMRNGTEVEITGGFKYGLTDDFLNLVRASPQVRTVHLNSVGGRLGEAQMLSKVIREKGLVTFVSGNCMSACTLAYAAGRERWVMRTARLGFHASYFPGMDDQDVRYADIGQREAFRNAGFAADFIERALATPHDDMWVPTLAELLESNVVTAISDGKDFATSGFGGALTRQQMEETLVRVTPALGALKNKSPDEYTQIIDVFYTSYINGETQETLVASTRQKLLPLIEAYLPLADDDVLVAYAKLIVEQYAALGAKDPELCYQFASGVDATKNFAVDLPVPLLKRELRLQERIIATAAKRPEIPEGATNRLWAAVGARMKSDHLTLLEQTPPPGKHADYCDASIGLFDAITGLKEADAGLLLREIWSES